MLIIPAIDLKNGQCVRLTEGREASAKVYDRDPIEVARSYSLAGATLIHVVDLDAAFSETAFDNRQVIREITRAITVPIEVGGGVRSLADIGYLIEDVGARYVILGTLAAQDPNALSEAINEFGDSIVVGIDARENRVAVRGWTDETKIDAIDLARRVADIGVRRIVYTDITRDGRLLGPNLDMTRYIAEAAGINVTASGGVASLEDLDRLCEIEPFGVDSVIVGKALYEGRFTLQAAIARVNRPMTS
jgi:phosphoribosylformimino-5-aminoimidazole carboxamide ribotide isomerase